MSIDTKRLRELAEAHIACRNAVNAAPDMDTRAAFLRAREELQHETMPEKIIALLDEIERLRERAYPLGAELHCEKHGYYDGRRGCASCLAAENEMHRQVLKEKLGAWQVSCELGNARWESRRLSEQLAAMTAARDELAEIAEQHWARQQIHLDQRDDALAVVAKLRKVGAP